MLYQYEITVHYIDGSTSVHHFETSDDVYLFERRTLRYDRDVSHWNVCTIDAD